MAYTVGAVTVVHEGRGGYVEIRGRRYVIEHVEGGRFCIHFPSGRRASDLEALEVLCASEPEKWWIERQPSRTATGSSRTRRRTRSS